MSDTSPVPGSLDDTVGEIEALGGVAMPVVSDFFDNDTLIAAIDEVTSTWGRVDVLVNNARYVGPGHQDYLLDTPIAYLEQAMQGNCLSALVLIQQVVPWMTRQGGGTIMNITSPAAYCDPSRPPRQGGWGLGYSLGKGALQRVAGALAVELADANIRVYNVQPGFVVNERNLLDPTTLDHRPPGAPPEAIGAVAVWLADSPDAARFNGKTVEAQHLCHVLGLLPAWPGPVPNTSPMTFDRAAAFAEQLEQELRTASAQESR